MEPFKTLTPAIDNAFATVETVSAMSRAKARTYAPAGIHARAHFLAWAIETVLGIMFFIILFGQVAYPLYEDVSTSGWDEYTVLLWGFIMFICLAAFTIRVIQSAKAGYVPLI